MGSPESSESSAPLDDAPASGTGEPSDPATDASPPAASAAPASLPDRTAGEYRRRDGVRLDGDVLVSTRPLAATRLNDAAVEVCSSLGADAFRSPAAVAAAVGRDPGTVATLLARLHRRGFLAWRPARDPSHRPPVSVVVTVRDDRDALLGCLDALAALDYPEYEVVVVDDGSTDGTREAAETHPLAESGRLRVVAVGRSAAPLGIGASRNRGVDAAAHDVIAFTDADCRPRTGWLADLVPCLAAHDLVGGRIRPHGDGPASAYEGRNSSLDMGPRAARVDPTGDTPYLATANLVGRRAVFEAVPFPDRNVAEDVAVCWGALDAGFDVVYAPAGVVEHDYRSGLLAFAARRTAYGASEALLARLHGRDGMGTVPVSPVALVALVALLGWLLAPAPSTGLLALAGAGGALWALGVGRRLWHRHRRLPTLALPDVVASGAREPLSAAYGLAREVSRYYAAPLAALGGLGWLIGGLVPSVAAAGAPLPVAALAVGARTLGLVLLVGVALALALPLAVECAVADRDAPVTAYARYYLADHLGYQRGVYRGALAHRTLAHLDPRSRFRPVGPGSGLVARLRATLRDR